MKSNFNFSKNLLILLLILFISCSEKKPVLVMEEDAPVFSLLSSMDTGITFANTSIETPERNVAQYDYFYTGSGVAIGDLNNDGLADIFFAGNDATNKMYLNQGAFKFKDISKQTGILSNHWSTGVTMVDINEDGFLDIYVCNSGPYLGDEALANQLYINNGDLTFTESASKYGINDSSYSSQASFFDMDNDGDLDLFVLNHSLIGYGGTIQEWEQALLNMDQATQKKSCNTLYRNDGGGKFTDITVESGILNAGFGLGVSISDFDENGFLDIYVTNDYFVPDFLFFNLGDGNFIENIKARATHGSYFAMGCDAADFNNDGLVDLVAVDMTPSDHYRSKTLMESMDTERFKFLSETKNFLPQYMFNTLNLNRGKGNFSEIAQFSGIAKTDWSWAALFVDLNNNSLKDLVITNGYKKDTKDRDWANALKKRYEKDGTTQEVFFDHLSKAKSTPLVNYIYENEGSLKFNDQSKAWGFKEPSFSQGAAYGDLDNDGDMDMVINNLEEEAFVYRNNTTEKGKTHFIQFTLSEGKNSSKIMNSKLKVYTGEQVQLVEYSFVRGYLSTMQPIAHFGLGEIETIDKVEIIWPDGKISTINNPEIDKKHHIDKSIISSVSLAKNKERAPFIDITRQAKGLNYKHQENEFNDYETEVLLPHKQSTLGPSLAVGDVNGDGMDDFYVGGAKGQSGQLYFQDSINGFVKSSQNTFNTDLAQEDVGAIFFDADSDGDLDLYVASGGGGDFVGNARLLQDRLYINAGDGTFMKAKNALPKITASTSSVTVNDWDGDGDLDLFVGGRTSPGKYPLPPESYLLQNENGHFKDVTLTLAPELRKIGMITNTNWTDVNGDGRQDLMVVGEWMAIQVFLNTIEGFKKAPESIGLPNDIGWWHSLDKGDFDNDGDDDFIVGNIGLNNKFHPKLEKPLHIFSNDFDENGSLDIVLSKLYKGNLAPVRGKECSTNQMPFIGENFPLFSDFASSTLEELYGAEKLEEALHYKATNFASMYIENMGDGTFTTKELPSETQLAPIEDIVVWDFDKDGNLDVIIGGNMFNTEAETPSYDAGKGLYLKGKGDGTFTTYLKVEDSGIFMPRNVKNLELLFLSSAKRPAVLVANNNNELNLFAWTK